MNGGRGGNWDASRSVPLVAIFFLVQSETESVERLGRGDGLIRLLNSSNQVSSLAMKILNDPEQKRDLNSKWFSNLTDIAAKVPMYRLSLSLNGEFWKNLDLIMSGNDEVSRS